MVRLRRAGLGFLALLGILALVVPAAPAASAGQAAGVTAGDSVIDRTPKDPRIAESSGLVDSRRSPGVVWTQNDSGNAPVLYAVDRSGTTVGTARVSGVANYDWEALAPLIGRDGSRLIAIGDIGDNDAVRSRIEIDVVAEPKATGSSRVRPVRVIHLQYPSGPVDAETLLADPRNGRLYIVTKGLFTATVYAVPTSAWPGGPDTPRSVTATLEPVCRVNLTMGTDGAVLPDGRVLLRTYSSLAVLPPLTSVHAESTEVPSLAPLAMTGVPKQRQGEGLAVIDPVVGVLLLSSEGVEEPMLRWSVPTRVWQAGAGPTSTGDGDTASAAEGAGAGSGGQQRPRATESAGSLSASGGGGVPDGRSAWLITLAGAGVFGTVLLLAGLLGWLRRP